MAGKPKVKHLYTTDPSGAYETECGLSTWKVSAVRGETACTCPDCPRIRRSRHEARMASDATYRTHHELIAAFAAKGIKAGRYGAISMTATEARKVLRRLRTGKEESDGR